MWQQLKNYYHLLQAFLANMYYDFPGRELTVIGVTGTDGKTTTTNLIYHILKLAGKRVSMISTISAVIGESTYDTGFHTTTPSSFAIQKYLRSAIKAGSEFMVLEVTSHALDQYRAWGIPIAIGVLTNVTHEHLDYHKTYNKYLKSKLKLLLQSGVCVVNRDDESYERMENGELRVENGRKCITFGLQNDADINPKKFQFKTPLLGSFNKYNCLAAIAVAKELGIPDDIIRKALASFKNLTGRYEIVHDNDFTVIIDFAHTPNALKQILSTLRSEYGKRGRIIHVFGSAGERDASKRPLMGKYSAEYSDISIITAEDPRSESIEKIIDAIVSGMEKKIEVLRIPDRQEAINKAIGLSKKGDVIIITGKGHEQSMNYRGKELPWSEHAAVQQALNKRSFSYKEKDRMSS